MRHAVLVVSVLIFGVLVLVLSALAEKRVALVIGNSAYQHVPALLNPANDARDIAAALRASASASAYC
jgi:Caspase domain